MHQYSPSDLSSTPSPTDDDRWLELIRSLRTHELAERFVEQLVNIPGYESTPVPLSEITATAAVVFGSMLRGLAAGGLPEPVPVASEVGVSRARAGLPITSLMNAIRLDYNVLWETIVAVSTASDAKLLVSRTGVILKTVDQYAGQVQRAYLAERERMREEKVSEQQGLIAQLFRDDAPNDLAQIERIAQSLGISACSRLQVVVSRGSDIDELRSAMQEAKDLGRIFFQHHLGDTLVIFFEEDERARHSRGGLRSIMHVAAGVCPAANLTEVRKSAYLASELLGELTSHDSGALTWDDGWSRVTKRILQNSGVSLTDHITQALETCGSAERFRLIEAVNSFLITGSVSRSAQCIPCHRNTVSNRLRRFTEVTGLNPTIPAEAALLVIGWSPLKQ